MEGLLALLLSGAGLLRCVFVESCTPDLAPPPSHFTRASTVMSNTPITGKTNLFLSITVEFEIPAQKIMPAGKSVRIRKFAKTGACPWTI